MCTELILQLESTIHILVSRGQKIYRKVLKYLLKVNLHLQIYLSESFLVAVCSAAIEVSASNSLVYNVISKYSVPVFDCF